MRRSLTSSCTKQHSLGPSHCGKDPGFPTALFPVLGDTSILALSLMTSCKSLSPFEIIELPESLLMRERDSQLWQFVLDLFVPSVI